MNFYLIIYLTKYQKLTNMSIIINSFFFLHCFPYIILNVTNGFIAGDLDNNGKVTLCDAIISLQSLFGMPVWASPEARILCNGGAVGTCEIIEILQVMARMK